MRPKSGVGDGVRPSVSESMTFLSSEHGIPSADQPLCGEIFIYFGDKNKPRTEARWEKMAAVTVRREEMQAANLT